MMQDTTPLLDCGHPPSPHSDSTAGYGTQQDGKKYCYECCAKLDMEDMRQTGRAVLYLVSNNRAVINWPGTLIIPVEDLTIGKHNVARTRYDIWFNFEGWEWWGVKYGEDTELVHCRRTKRKA